MKKKIIVIGDVMIDRYLYAEVNRICPEAPIPISNIKKIENKLGGAGNLVLNIKNLLDEPNQIILISVLGNDNESIIIEELCVKNNIQTFFIKDVTRKTTIKNRIYSNDHMINRFDIEDTHEICFSIQTQILEFMNKKLLDKIEYVVISDYNKGVITDFFCSNLLNYCESQQILTFVDPKVSNYERYKNCYLIKPNLSEAKNMYSFLINKLNQNKNDLSLNNFYNSNEYEKNNINIILNDLYQNLNCKYIVCTCGKDGMIFYTNLSKSEIKHQNPDNIFAKDVTGSGDVVFAVLISQFYKTKNLYESVLCANYIGGLSVQTIGTYLCNKEDIESYYKVGQCLEDEPLKLNNKTIQYRNNDNLIFNFVINQIKKNKKKIIFTNGCFDILHLGHLELLKYCKSLGDYLIVGLNSDSSIKKLKGQNRPIHNQDYRSKFLSFFDFVDLIIIFDEDTPSKLLEKIKPNILVKGGDYTLDKIIGKEFVEEVKIFNTIENYSSTNIISSINSRS